MADMAGLVRNAQAGDKEAFVDLIESCKQGLYKTAIAMLRNDADAADAIQDAVLNSYENLQSLKKPQFFKTWITRILINQCNRILKRRGNIVPIHEHPELEYTAPDTSGRAFIELLNKLEEQYRIVLYLFYVEEFSIKEISSILEMNENTVKTRLSRGRGNFRKLYMRENQISCC